MYFLRISKRATYHYFMNIQKHHYTNQGLTDEVTDGADFLPQKKLKWQVRIQKYTFQLFVPAQIKILDVVIGTT